LSYSIDTGLLRDGGALVVGLAIFIAVLALRPKWRPTRRQAVWIGAAWLAVWSLEYWIFGPASFIHYYDEGDSFVPLLLYRATQFAGGDFAHAVEGGSDAASMSLTGGQFVSIEQLLFSVLPLWLALLFHKLAVATTAFAGSYLLCRRLADCDRLVALGLAGFFSLSHAYLTISTTHHGIGYAAVPLAMILIAGRTDRAGYYFPVVVFSLIVAASVSPTHSLLAIALGLVCAALLFRAHQPAFNWVRFLSGGGILALAVLANWAGMLYGLARYAPYSARGNSAPTTQFAPADIVPVAADFALSKIPAAGVVAPFLLVALVLLWRRRDALSLSATAAIVLGLFAGAALMTVPWPAIGLAPVASMRLLVSEFCLPAIAIAVMARAFAFFPARGGSFVSAAPVAVAAALAVGSLFWFKSFNAVNFLGEGGQRTMTSIPNLAARDWQTGIPSRVVTVPFRLPPMAALTYGLDTLDGYVNMVPAARARFWRFALSRPRPAPEDRNPRALGGGDLNIAPPGTDYRGASSFELRRWVDIDLLRLGNVGYVISYVPLTDPELRQASGPATRPDAARRSLSFTAKAAADMRRIFQPDEPYVFALPAPVPLMYFARGLVRAPDDADIADFFDRAKAQALEGAALARQRDVPAGATVPDPALPGVIRSIAEVRNGWDVSVEAPKGGLLVVNTVHMPFWSATADRKRAGTFSVNGIHFAVAVPPGAKSVRLRYVRERLGEAVGGSG
jgi:hypothetical protein